MVEIMRTPKWLVLVLLLLVMTLASCASQNLPAGYESVRAEATLVEASAYIKAMRDSYVTAREKGILTPAQFQTAVKADQSLTAIWNRYLAAVKVKSDDYKLYAEVVQATTTLENLLIAWIPEFTGTAKKKPAVLGAK
jgi:hypothetical protein